MRYNVAVQGDGYFWLLTLEGFPSKAAAERAIRWQREGDFHQTMFVVEPRYGRGTNRWTVLSAHRSKQANSPRYSLSFYRGYTIRPINNAWTKEAWKRLISTVWPPKQPLMVPA